MMSVLLFIDNLGSGGAQRQFVGLATLLKQTGIDVRVCTYFPQDFYKPYLDANGIPNEVIPNAEDTKKRIWAVRQHFKKIHPDWVIAYQETPSLVACICKILGCEFKLIVSERSSTQYVGVKERIRFFLYRFADAIVPNSFSQEKWLENHYPWMKKRITTITNFVDLEKFRYVSHRRHEVPEIVVAASLIPSKNAVGFIEACSILKNKGLKFHISWYGISSGWEEYHKLCVDTIAKNELEDHVSIFEKTPKIDEKYRDCDYFCLPSFFEGMPNVICEAISTGVPIMCSDINDNRLYVHEGMNGILFNPQSPKDISEKMEILLSQSDDEYLKYRVNSRQIAESNFSKEQFVNKYLYLLNNNVF